MSAERNTVADKDATDIVYQRKVETEEKDALITPFAKNTGSSGENHSFAAVLAKVGSYFGLIFIQFQHYLLVV